MPINGFANKLTIPLMSSGNPTARLLVLPVIHEALPRPMNRVCDFRAAKIATRGQCVILVTFTTLSAS